MTYCTHAHTCPQVQMAELGHAHFLILLMQTKDHTQLLREVPNSRLVVVHTCWLQLAAQVRI